MNAHKTNRIGEACKFSPYALDKKQQFLCENKLAKVTNFNFPAAKITEDMKYVDKIKSIMAKVKTVLRLLRP